MKQDPEEIPAKTVDEYLAAVPEETRTVLENLRSTIKAVAPEAEEVISYRIPTYKYHGALVHFAAFMDHCSFIVVSRSILEKFRNELRPYATSGTTIHFSAEHPLPATLIGDIVRTGMTENEALWKSLLKKGSPPCASPTPLGWGRLRFLRITGNPYPGNTTQSQPGRHSGGAKPLERYQKRGFLQTENETRAKKIRTGKSSLAD